MFTKYRLCVRCDISSGPTILIKNDPPFSCRFKHTLSSNRFIERVDHSHINLLTFLYVGLNALRARFDITSGPTTPVPIAVQFTGEGSTISLLNFDLKSPAYKLSLVKKRFASGKSWILILQNLLNRSCSSMRALRVLHISLTLVENVVS